MGTMPQCCINDQVRLQMVWNWLVCFCYFIFSCLSHYHPQSWRGRESAWLVWTQLEGMFVFVCVCGGGVEAGLTVYLACKFLE